MIFTISGLSIVFIRFNTRAASRENLFLHKRRSAVRLLHNIHNAFLLLCKSESLSPCAVAVQPGFFCQTMSKTESFLAMLLI